MVDRYQRSLHRTGRLPVRIKIYQAIGALPDVFKNFAFNTFVLLLYNQILGLPAALASAALLIALVFDAVTDPLVGSYSDRLQSRLGRRHPLMYLSSLPLALSLYCLLIPPDSLGQGALFGWLLVFAVLARGSMTLFLVPWSALFAELSDDYAERSAILTYRFIVGGIGGVAFVLLTWTFIFPSSEQYPQGQLNPEGYASFALFLALAVLVTVLLTTRLTQNQVRYLRQPVSAMPFAVFTPVRDLAQAVRNRDFLVLFVGLLISSVLMGVLAAFEIYFNTFFWGFASEDLRWMTFAIFGGLIGAALIPALQRRFDKKHILLAAMCFSLADG
ncbi:MAG: MFS transporter, partial [Halioglobus sp.]|nr:MFS transporter [Halioglobus sp.]